MANQNMKFTYNELLFNYDKESSINKYYNVDDLQEHHTK